MYHTYRFKEHEPSFYFVKNVEKTKNEFALWNMAKTGFSGQWRDKYHFFVIQVIKGANPNDDDRKQYLVTSAQNDGDKHMSWNDILQIEPKLQGLKQEFVNVPLTDVEKEDYKKFINGVSDAEFRKLTYEQKNRYLEVYVRTDKKLSVSQFADLPDDLKNKYVGFGIGLTDEQFELVKANGKLLNRYKEIVLRKADEAIKNKDVMSKIIYNIERSEIDIINNSSLSKQFLDGILTHSFHEYLAFRYAQALGLKNVPQAIIDCVAEDSDYSLDYAKKLGFKDVPRAIIVGVAQHPSNSFDYAKGLDFKDVPRKIIYGIIDCTTDDSDYSLDYAQKLGFKNVPPAIIMGIAQYSYNAFKYAKGLDFKDVPQEIIEAIARDMRISSDYFKILKKLGLKAPQEIVNSAAGIDYYWNK